MAYGIPAMSKSELQREVAYRRILDLIVAGGLPPNEPLSERGLSAQLSIGRMPIREAIRDLARDGVLDILPVRGTFVRAITDEQIHELFDIRQSLECLAVQRAAERGPTPELREFGQALRESVDDTNANNELDTIYKTGVEFHVELVRASANALLLEMYLPLRVRYRVLMGLAQFYDQDWVRAGVDDHLAILDAVEHRDSTLARELMSAHLERSYQSKLKIITDMRSNPSLAGTGSSTVLPFTRNN